MESSTLANVAGPDDGVEVVEADVVDDGAEVLVVDVTADVDATVLVDGVVLVGLAAADVAPRSALSAATAFVAASTLPDLRARRRSRKSDMNCWKGDWTLDAAWVLAEAPDAPVMGLDMRVTSYEKRSRALTTPSLS